jgi:hypothetical protein
MIKEIQIIKKIKDSLKELFKSAQIARVVNLIGNGEITKNRTNRMRPDLIVELETKNKKRYQLIVEVKSTGQPRLARMAINQLQAMIENRPNAYGIIAAPYISEESKQICKESNMGYIDMAGNCFLRFDEIYINIEGKTNPYPYTWSLKTLFSPISSRALRVLFSDVKKYWSTTDLSNEAKMSLGLVTKVKQFLLENELAQEIREVKSRKFRLTDPEQLLNKWSIEYNYQQNILYEYYSMDDIKVFERKMPEILIDANIEFAFSLTSGASLVAPNLRYRRVFVYIDKDKINEAANLLKLKHVSSGANIILMAPYDSGVFYGLQDIAGAKVVSDIQLYLDLRNYKERGEEAAQFILQERIRNRW